MHAKVPVARKSEETPSKSAADRRNVRDVQERTRGPYTTPLVTPYVTKVAVPAHGNSARSAFARAPGAVTTDVASTGTTDAESDVAKDHFIVRDGQEFAGTHLILDLWGAKDLGDLDYMKAAMVEAVEVAGATLLHIHLHHFGEGSGVSGVAVLAESHISVHTWPERDFAAFDVFMCGDAEPMRAVEVLKRKFGAERAELLEARRGLV